MHKNLYVVVSAIWGVSLSLFPGISHAGMVEENLFQEDTSLIEYPLYEIKGDVPAESGFSFTTKEVGKKVTNQKKTSCDEKLKLFKMKEDSFMDANGSTVKNVHDGFPYVSATPTKLDQLPTRFFKEKISGNFFVSKWSTQTFPIVTFHVSEESQKYYLDVKKVIDRLNERAWKDGIILKDQKLVELDSVFIPLSENDCNKHIIHVDDDAIGGGTQIVRENEDSKRLGQILDTDIIVTSPQNPFKYSEEKINYIFSHNDPVVMKNYFQNYFSRTLLHEIFHSLGLVHNFAAANTMDYMPMRGGKHFEVADENGGQFIQVFDEKLGEEMETLKFLYSKKYVKNKITWALVRSINPGTTMVKPHELETKKILNATTDVKSSSFLCTFKDSAKKVDFTSFISKSFKIILSSRNYPDQTIENFTGMGFVGLSFSNLLPQSSIWVVDLHRIFPVIDFSESQKFTAIVNTSGANLVNKNTILVRKSEYSNAFTDRSSSQIDWLIEFEDQNCELKVDFTVTE